MAALVLSGAGLAKANAQVSTSAASLVFDEVTVVDVQDGKLVPAQRVVIVGNRIQLVGDVHAIKIPTGARVVDARGKYLIPGLWDMHTHSRYLAHLFYPLFIANGVTGIRDAWSDIPLDSLVSWRQAILAGKSVGPPRQLLAGNALRQGEEIESAKAQQIVDSLKAHGANFIKTYPFSFVLAAAVRQAGLPFGGHVDGVSAIEASDSGITIVDHQDPVFESCLAPEASAEECRQVAERFRRNGTWWVPALVRRDDRGPATPNPASQAVLDRLRKDTRAFWSDSAPARHGADRADPDSIQIRIPNAPPPDSVNDALGFLRLARRVGLPTLAGTDAGAPVIRQILPGLALHVELAIYVAEGLTPLEALQSATLNPAKMLRATDSLGTVATGKLADLVLLDADPLADITNTTAIRAVVANGRYFDRMALDRLLAEVRAKAKEVEAEDENPAP